MTPAALHGEVVHFFACDIAYDMQRIPMASLLGCLCQRQMCSLSLIVGGQDKVRSPRLAMKRISFKSCLEQRVASPSERPYA